MSRAPRLSRRLHPALALALAGATHACLFAATHWLGPKLPAQGSRNAAHANTGVELSLIEPAVAPQPERVALPGRSPAKPPLAGRATAHRAASERGSASSDAVSPADASLEPSAAQPAAPATGVAVAARRSIDLGLNGGVMRSATLEGWLAPEPAPLRPSPGWLVEGLAALDAARGLSRSSAATQPAYQAARRAAPALGMGVFDILTNEQGVVLSVTLVSAGAEPAAWERVGQELHALLRDRPLRVPPGAKGLLARLRIERGELAQEPAERGRTERGVALGQTPLHPREQRHESTRGSLEPGQLTPTLGVLLAGGASGDRIRVVLLSERAL